MCCYMKLLNYQKVSVFRPFKNDSWLKPRNTEKLSAKKRESLQIMISP